MENASPRVQPHWFIPKARDSLSANQRATVLLLQKNTAVPLLYGHKKLLRRKMHFVHRDCKIHLLMSTEPKQDWKTQRIPHSWCSCMEKGSEMIHSACTC